MSLSLNKIFPHAGHDLLIRELALDSRNVRTGMVQRYTQISFELTDLESGEIVWAGIYEFARAAADDVIYR